ncbi:MAG: hypothetical protein R3F02_07495 [Thiolinea sp.]
MQNIWKMAQHDTRQGGKKDLPAAEMRGDHCQYRWIRHSTENMPPKNEAE